MGIKVEVIQARIMLAAIRRYQNAGLRKIKNKNVAIKTIVVSIQAVLRMVYAKRKRIAATIPISADVSIHCDFMFGSLFGFVYERTISWRLNVFCRFVIFNRIVRKFYIENSFANVR